MQPKGCKEDGVDANDLGEAQWIAVVCNMCDKMPKPRKGIKIISYKKEQRCIAYKDRMRGIRRSRENERQPTRCSLDRKN